MKVAPPKFRVGVPFGRFSCREIITARDLRKRRGIARELNKRPLTPEYARELQNQGYVFSAQSIERQGRVRPEDVQYENLIGDSGLYIDPPPPQDAAEHFLEFMDTKRINKVMVEKAPLLSAFLDAIAIQEDDRFRIGLKSVEILARAKASEKVLCAALYREIVRAMERAKSENVQLTGEDLAFREIYCCGRRLGVAREIIMEGLKEAQSIILEAERAVNRTLVSGVLACWRPEKSKKGIINLVNLTRSLLARREVRMLYAAFALEAISDYAEEKYQNAKERLDRVRSEGGDLTQVIQEMARKTVGEEAYKLHYFLQVLPVIEELNVFYLTEMAKDIYFKAFKPVDYWKIQEWFREIWGFSYPMAQRHLLNMIRLIREVGQKTGLLPEGVIVEGRIKSPQSIHEKLIHEYGEASAENFCKIHDIFGIKILVPELAEVNNVVHMLRQTFLKVSAALRQIHGRESYRKSLPLHCIAPSLTDYGLFERELNRYNSLRRYEELTLQELIRRGYVDGERDSISTPPREGHGRVPYYYMIFATYHFIPLEIEITTQGLEAQINKRKPHWKYKFRKQLEVGKVAERITEKDLAIRKQGIYVVILDEGLHELGVEFVPEEKANAAAFPGHLRQYDSEEEMYEREPEEMPLGSIKLKNGDILIKPSRSG
jgi:hypothetical protein